MSLSEKQQIRYSRVIIMDDVGEAGQERICGGRVLVVGLGGLGCPCTMYLAAGGVQQLVLVDDDLIEETNLARQILYGEDDIGRYKVSVAKEKISCINGDCEVIIHKEKLDKDNVDSLVKGADIIVDGTDNMSSRLLLSDSCYRYGKPLVFGALQGYEGEVGVFWPQGESGVYLGESSCLRCLYPEEPRLPSNVGRCDVVGVWGPLVGIIGSMQALAVLQLFAHPHKVNRGQILLFDGREFRAEKFIIPKDKKCHICSQIK